MLNGTEMKDVFQAQGGYKVLVSLEAEIQRIYNRVKGDEKSE